MAFSSIRNQLRGMLHIRKPRATPRRGAKPAIGAPAIREDVRMTIQAGMSDELWKWLLEQGWREATYEPDRRRYRDVPSTWVTRLIDAEPEARPEVLRAAVERAVLRPSLRGAPSLRAVPRRR